METPTARKRIHVPWYFMLEYLNDRAAANIADNPYGASRMLAMRKDLESYSIVASNAESAWERARKPAAKITRRELGRMFRVADVTIRRHLRKLESMGLPVLSDGGGCKAREYDRHEAVSMLANMLGVPTPTKTPLWKRPTVD